MDLPFSGYITEVDPYCLVEVPYPKETSTIAPSLQNAAVAILVPRPQSEEGRRIGLGS